MSKEFGKDLTTGSIPGNLVRFALPILIGNILSTGYSVVNTMWVGNLIGKDAVAAVAVSFPIFLAMVALCSGSTMATSIQISRAYGAKNKEEIQRIVNSSWLLALIMIVTIIASGLFCCEYLLKIMRTPAEITDLAAGYLRITIINFAGLYISYLISSILRGVGDTVIPMICVIFSTVLNAILDPVLILGIGPFPRLGINGSAYSDMIATIFTILLGVYYILRKYRNEPVNPTRMLLEKGTGKEIMSMMKIGLPFFVQQMMISLSYACITVFVNRFSAASTAAYGIASKIDSIAAMPAMAVMMAVSALTAQNIGAGKYEKIKDILKYGILINIPLLMMISLLCITFPGQIMRAFVPDMQVAKVGVDYLRIVGAGYILFSVFYVTNGIINGAGKTLSTMIISFVSLCVIRIPLAGILSHTALGIRGIWIAIVISFAISLLNSFLYYSFGGWKSAMKAEKVISAVKEGEEAVCIP